MRTASLFPRRVRVIAPAAALAVAASLVVTSAPAQADLFPSGFATWHEVALAAPGGSAGAMATDGAGHVWYADDLNNQIVMVTPSTGTSTAHDLGASRPSVNDLVVGADGNAWFGDSRNASIDRLDPRTGVLDTFPLGGPFSGAYSLTVAADGSVWFGDTEGGGIARIENDGTITRYPDPSGALVFHLVQGGDGRFWYTRDGLSSLGALDPKTGVVEVVPVGLSGMSGMAVSAAGDIWVGGTGALARVGLDGSVSVTSIPSPTFEPVVPRSLRPGVAATLYFTDEHQGIGRIDLAGNLTFQKPPFAGSVPSSLAVTTDGFLWYTDFGRATIGWV